MSIRGVGILQIKPGCVAEQEDVTLWGSPITEGKLPEYKDPKVLLHLKKIDEEVISKNLAIRKQDLKDSRVIIQAT